MKSLNRLTKSLGAGRRPIIDSFCFFSISVVYSYKSEAQISWPELWISQTLAVLCISPTNAPKLKINLKLLSPPSSCAGNNCPVTHLQSTLDFCLFLTLQCVFISTPHFTSKILKQVYFPDLFTILTSATVDHNGEWAILSGSGFFPLRVRLLLSHAHTELE